MGNKKDAKTEFLPMTAGEMDQLGWDALDILLVTGDAYVDQPSFGTALLGRWLNAHGYRVGIVAQPRWDTDADFIKMGRPKLFVGVTAGALDSMLAHYTAFRKKRHDDAYTPGGRAGARPNRATIVYANIARHAFPGLPVVIGGIEASMRRVAHYDFWSDSIRNSILLDSKADLLVYGMAERAIFEVAEKLNKARNKDDKNDRELLRGIHGTVYAGKSEADVPAGKKHVKLPSYDEIIEDKRKLMDATLLMERHVHEAGLWATQRSGKQVIIVAPPAKPLTSDELDKLYSLPFTRCQHFSYSQPVPAVKVTQFSVVTHRGCAGGCSFCSLALHQGRRIASRSERSIMAEVDGMTLHKEWSGSLTDIGGPSANMWQAGCRIDCKECKRASCLFPGICGNFQCDQTSLLNLLTAVSEKPGVKHVRVASGIRHDLALEDEKYVRGTAKQFVGGQLKLAPEHCVDAVLRLMRKPGFDVFEKFMDVFERYSSEAGKEQYIVPYLISAFPGCTIDDMRALVLWLKKRGWGPRQVQCFIPTPGTVATAMYHAGIDPDGASIYVARTDAERMRQHGLLISSIKRKKR